jgi:hypothetical protein
MQEQGPDANTKEEWRGSHYRERGLLDIKKFLEESLGTEAQQQFEAEAFFGTILATPNDQTTNTSPWGTEYRKTPTGLLTKEEVADFTLFARRAIKRILNAFQHKYKDPTWTKDSINARSLFHDVSHAAGMIASGKYKQQDNSIVLPFLHTPLGEDFSNREFMEDELYGILWNVIQIDKKPGQYVLKTLRESSTESEFIKAYVEGVMSAAVGANRNHIYRRLAAVRKDLSPEELEQETTALRSKAIETAKEIENNPPTKIIEILHYIWEHRDNKRVLADLFFREVGPYIEELKKRDEYSDRPLEDIVDGRESVAGGIEDTPLREAA